MLLLATRKETMPLASHKHKTVFNYPSSSDSYITCILVPLDKKETKGGLNSS
jgi:hypothetical protein